MPYSRRVVHYSPGPTDLKGVISDRAVAGCWFELHRQGGCGAAELRLRDEFVDRDDIDVGDWIALEFEAGDRWYLGRVKNRRANSPAGITLRLEGMGVELDEAFPGGFGRAIADGVPPHRYAATDLFQNDPDYTDETVDSVSEPSEVVTLLMQQYVVPATNITLDTSLIESPLEPAELTSLKFRGEESVRAVVKDLAVRARGASWGVDENGTFFFLRPRNNVIASYREGLDLLSLAESRDREILFNRVVLTGGFIYADLESSDAISRGFYRWRGNYVQPASRSQHGERRIRVWVPWIRTRTDSREFVREFFRIYKEPTTRYLIEAGDQSTLPRPWNGSIRIESRDGSELMTAQVATVRVQFDHAPRLRMEVGPVDPRTQWPEPPHEDRSVLPNMPDPERGGGDIITFSSESSFSSLSSSSSGSVFVKDTFTDSDGTSLLSHTSDSGHQWGITASGGGASLAINNNQCRISQSGSASANVSEQLQANLSGTMTCHVGNSTNGSEVGFVTRFSGLTDYWLLMLSSESHVFGPNTIKISEINGGAETIRASASKTIDFDTTYEATFTADGTTISYTVDGTTISYANATFNQTAVNHGLRLGNHGGVTNLTRCDNFVLTEP